MRARRSLFAAALLAVAGCAGSYRPIVDMKGVDAAAYERDLEECRAYADAVDPGAQAATGGLLAGGFGAALGAALGAIGGDPGFGAATGAAAGGITGTASAAAGCAGQQRAVIDNCLRGRGYSVLG
jgi:outer membrane lipoprotein SlyB